MRKDGQNPRVSILLPVWNAEVTLATCLRSLLRQSEMAWECLLVDDGSTDRSGEIATAFAASDARFRVVTQPHAGLVATLNHGMQRCRAPIVARMDADDWMHRDRLALQCEALERDHRLEAVGAFVRIFPRVALRDGRRHYEDWLNAQSDPQTIWRERFIECPIAHPALAIRRDTLLSLRYRDLGWPEDYDLILRLLRSGPCIGIVTHRLIGWRDRADRLSRNHPSYGLDRFTACRAWHLHRDFLAERGPYILWGHGPTGRALRRELKRLGHHARAIIEVHPRRIGNHIDGVPVIALDALAEQPSDPIIVSVAGARPRGEIRSALRDKGLREGIEFVCAA